MPYCKEEGIVRTKARGVRALKMDVNPQKMLEIYKYLPDKVVKVQVNGMNVTIVEKNRLVVVGHLTDEYAALVEGKSIDCDEYLITGGGSKAYGLNVKFRVHEP